MIESTTLQFVGLDVHRDTRRCSIRMAGVERGEPTGFRPRKRDRRGSPTPSLGVRGWVPRGSVLCHATYSEPVGYGRGTPVNMPIS